MATYEMFWDCPACGAEKLLGKSHRHCPACGHVQDPSLRYFPAEHEKVAVEDHRFVGVDWSCERCETPNSGAASHCVNCGDARDGSEADVSRRSNVDAGSQAGAFAASPTPLADRSAPKPGLSSLWKLVAVVAGLLMLLAVVGCCVSLLWTKQTSAEVSGHHWERNVRIETKKSVSDGDWCESMPSGAYSVSRSQKERSSNAIPDGETCSTVNKDNGDGTFSTHQQCTTKYRYEPVYDDYCSYRIDRWQHDRTETRTGQGLQPAPSWPSHQVSGGAGLGSTRVGSKSGAYYVTLMDADGTQKDCDYDEKKWASMKVGSKWSGRKRVLLDSLVCSGLVREGK